MGCSAPRRTGAVVLAVVALTALLFTTAGAAQAKPLVVKNGRIHACYKVKGKAKGTVRLVASAKVRCPRGWKKAAWNTSGAPGAAGEPGSTGENGSGGEGGQAGGKGEAGALTTGTKVASLETKVTELLSQVKSLEAILSGITNAGLKEAIGKVPAVAALCGQTKALNEQTTALGTTLGGLSAIIDTLTVLGLPAVPTALPAFSCP